jgi:succinoglycan biosynthesis protein ExoO
MPVSPATDQPASNAPLVSLIIACRNVGPYIDAAIWSARRQSLADIEILVIDDGSTDDTRQRLAAHVAADQRLRLLDGPGRGPAAARNIGLQAARGTWIGILDGDDILHPRRLELMLSASVTATSDILADNQILFYEDGSPSQYLLQGADWQQPRPIDLPLYIRANTMFGKGPALGYLKPLIRRSRFADATLRYDESLRIGEDYDLVARLLRDGARFAFLPTAWYFYRRHNASISFRLADSDLAALIAAADRFQSTLPAQLTATHMAARQRRVGLLRAHHFARLVARLKARDLVGAIADLVWHPSLLPLLLNATCEGLQRRLRRTPPAATPGQVMSHTEKACSLIWAGDPAVAATTLAWLAGLGWQTDLHAVPEAGGAAVAHQSDTMALAMTTSRNRQLVLCKMERLLDLVPYLLSPDALVGVLKTPGTPAAGLAAPDIAWVTAGTLDRDQLGERLRALGLG